MMHCRDAEAGYTLELMNMQDLKDMQSKRLKHKKSQIKITKPITNKPHG